MWLFLAGLIAAFWSPLRRCTGIGCRVSQPNLGEGTRHARVRASPIDREVCRERKARWRSAPKASAGKLYFDVTDAAAVFAALEDCAKTLR